jgi:archaellum component FlaC
LLTQESELISAIQGIGFMDYDVDSYVDKLETIIKKKMKMYEVLSRKVANFKKYLSEEDEMRKNVKNVNYY